MPAPEPTPPVPASAAVSAGLRSDPGPFERACAIALYLPALLPLAMIAVPEVRKLAGAARFPWMALVSAPLVLAAITRTWMKWGQFVRNPPYTLWFFTHQFRIIRMYAYSAVAFILGFFVMFGALLFVLDKKEFAFVAVYGPLAVWLLTVLWLALRALFGIRALLRGEPTGSPPDGM